MTISLPGYSCSRRYWMLSGEIGVGVGVGVLVGVGDRVAVGVDVAGVVGVAEGTGVPASVGASPTAAAVGCVGTGTTSWSRLQAASTRSSTTRIALSDRYRLARLEIVGHSFHENDYRANWSMLQLGTSPKAIPSELDPSGVRPFGC